jgi:DNA-binding IclR family transcriptional regulator
MSELMQSENGGGRSSVQSVDRAISVLEILARDGWSGVTEIARELDVHKSTVSRLVATLEARGLVEQHPGSQKYRLGFALARLAAGVSRQADLVDAARATCEELSAAADETVNLAVLQDGQVTSIEQVNLSSSVIAVDWVGQPHPLHVTASGKVFLAFGHDELLATTLRGGLAPHTARSLTDPEELRVQLGVVRSRGYATTAGELERGLHAAAAPVRDAGGAVVAAIVVSGPEYRLPLDRLERLGEQVRDAADEVARRLGWLGTAPADVGR